MFAVMSWKDFYILRVGRRTFLIWTGKAQHTHAGVFEIWRAKMSRVFIFGPYGFGFIHLTASKKEG